MVVSGGKVWMRRARWDRRSRCCGHVSWIDSTTGVDRWASGACESISKVRAYVKEKRLKSRMDGLIDGLYTHRTHMHMPVRAVAR